MKNQLSIIALIFAFLVLLSCSKKIDENKSSSFEIKTDQISKDNSFKSIIELENNLSDEIKNVM